MALIDLTKKVGIVLAKRNMPNVVAQVGFAIDISGSMQGMYSNGTVQKVVDRLLAIANKFDDNGSLDAWAFQNSAFDLAPATEADFENEYVKRNILKNSKVNLWGGTSYAPVMEKITEHYFGASTAPAKSSGGLFGGLFGKKNAPAAASSEETADPVFIIFVTDGENDDKSDTRKMIEQYADKNIYWEFVGIGNGSDFNFLKQIADEYPNVGYVGIRDIGKMPEEDLYLELLNEEFCGWVKDHAAVTA